MHHDLRRRRGRHTSMRDKISTDELPDADYDHQQHRATATPAATTEAACSASSPVGTTETAATRHRTAMERTHGAVAEGGRSYHHARGATLNEAPASTVVSKGARPPVPNTMTTINSTRKPHHYVLRDTHDPSPNPPATPTGLCVTARDGGGSRGGGSRGGGDGTCRGGKTPRSFTAPKLPPEGVRTASFSQSSERDRGT